MKYPKNDKQFEDIIITAVITAVEGNCIQRNNGWLFFAPPDSPVKPEVGMRARFYGKGIGSTFRGLFLDGEQGFDRTEFEEYD